MAIRTVSNASELTATIRSANSGDTIKLKPGNYGQVNIANSNKVLTIESESAWSQATFKGIQVQKSSNLTFDNLNFQGTTSGGWGSGYGVKAWDSRNIKIENSDFQDYYKSISIANSQGITVVRNEFERASEDAMAFTGIDGLQILDNQVKGMKAPIQEHHDLIQVHTAGGASSNVVIRGNVLDSNDLQTYGITFFGSAPHRNVTIDDNTVISGHKHGITVNQIAGLKITNNIVMKDGSNNSFRDIDTPEINVGSASSGVQITGNTAYGINSAAGGVGSNNIISESVKFSGSTIPTGSSSGSGAAPDPTPPPSSGGGGDVFRFDGDSVKGWTKTYARDIDFAAGDKIELTDYDAGTFKQQSGGNWLQVSGDGRMATLDSGADVQELINASPDVSSQVYGQNLMLRVQQDSGNHAIWLTNLGNVQDFLSSGASGSGSSTGSSSGGSAPSSDGDVFRFSGSDVNGWTRVVARNVDLGTGDEIQFTGYDQGTFKQQSGGNPLQVSGDGLTATIDSRADIKELIAASPDISTQNWDDTLALIIKQDDGVHSVILHDIGDPGYFL